jgi:hypothetical protein
MGLQVVMKMQELERGESMIGGGKVLFQMVVFHTITNKVFNAIMI